MYARIRNVLDLHKNRIFEPITYNQCLDNTASAKPHSHRDLGRWLLLRRFERESAHAVTWCTPHQTLHVGTNFSDFGRPTLQQF